MSGEALYWVADTGFTVGASTYYFMWDDKAFYFAANVTDTSEPSATPKYGDALNSGDGTQLGIFGVDGKVAGQGTDHLFFTFHPKADNGQPDIYEHFNIIKQIANSEYGAAIASVMNGSSYTLEATIPWSVFATIFTNGFVNEIKGVEGQKMLISPCIMDINQGGQSLGTATGWFDAATTDTFVLTADAAGIDPNPPVVEEEVVAPVDENPDTADVGIISYVLASLSLLGGLIIKKKQ
ncbi:MAG: Carbohydrate family 9 binding domain-like [Clostridia bacterium]|nr:Carbohydrate family 9 binding domain-like [Clostridia bacterium]